MFVMLSRLAQALVNTDVWARVAVREGNLQIGLSFVFHTQGTSLDVSGRSTSSVTGSPASALIPSNGALKRTVRILLHCTGVVTRYP